MAFVDLVDRNKKNKMVVTEIGVYNGVTTKKYIDIIKQNNGHLFVIDWFKGNENVSEGIHKYDESNSDNVYNCFLNDFENYSDVITILSGKSSDMISQIPDNSLDICFIDADHRYSNVYRDIELCLPKMKPGGLLCGHDMEDIQLANKFNQEDLEEDCANNVHCGVIQAVYDHFGFDIISINDPYGQEIPIWIKQI